MTVLLAAGVAAPASADPHRDESGHGRGRGHHKHHHKQEYWDGACKVERKFDKKGGYKEERKCHGADPYGAHVHAPAYPPVAAPAPGIYVQPPAVILQPPGVVIR